MLSSFRWIKDGFFPKNNVNLIINITCLLQVSYCRPWFIFECINLSVQDLFLGELLQAMISIAWD
jgi:hypothetical protein